MKRTRTLFVKNSPHPFPLLPSRVAPCRPLAGCPLFWPAFPGEDHDAVDVGLGEYVQKGSTAPWLATYRLLKKNSPCLPEVAIRMASLSEFDRSYSHVLLYPPQPEVVRDLEGRQKSFSGKMYGFYVAEMRETRDAGAVIEQSFMKWHRSREYDAQTCGCRERGVRATWGEPKTLVVACRYWYELTDGFWGQFVLTQIPQLCADDILPKEYQHLDCMKNWAGMLEYLCTWKWQDVDVISGGSGILFRVCALPLLVEDGGEVQGVGRYSEGMSVFGSDRDAYEYLVRLARRDLQYRGFRDERVICFEYKSEANFLLYRRVRAASDEHEYKMLRQSWDGVNRPKYAGKRWSGAQEEALALVEAAVSHEDEETLQKSRRFLYVQGLPGSGKSAILLEAAIRLARKGLCVLSVCPTGTNVYSFKSRLPDFDGVDNHLRSARLEQGTKKHIHAVWSVDRGKYGGPRCNLYGIRGQT